jgi:hypothetical protein
MLKRKSVFVFAPPPPIATAGPAERRTPTVPCRNCGDPTVGNYCPSCGQRKIEVRVSMRRMLMEALEDQLSINSTLPRTLGALFFRPGHLTREYVAGRIVRYVPPFRLYLVASLAFFLSLSLVPLLRDPTGKEHLMVGGLKVNIGETSTTPPGAAADAGKAPEKKGGWLGNFQVHTASTALDTLISQKLKRLNEMESNDAARTLVGEYVSRFPQMMFLLLPAFAAVLKLLYLRQKRFYVEHFVFALHLHAFAFASFMVMFLTGSEAVVLALCSWLTLYVYMAMKRVYGQGWFRTGVKYLMLGAIYNVMMFIAGSLLLVVTILLL